MISAISKYMPRWLMAIIATALVLATVVGSGQDSAEAIDPADTDTVYIADGTNFADALMGATIAALNTSPMLGVAGTNTGDTIPGDTVEELDRLTNNKTDLLDTIFVFGGSNAVSDSVVSQLGAWANDVQRIAGDSRWGTYEAISQMLPSMIDEAAHAQEADNADTLDGKDSGDFALSDQACAAGQVVTGIAADGTPSCAVDQVDGGNAETLDGKDSTAYSTLTFETHKASGLDSFIASTELLQLDVSVPVDGTLVLNYSASLQYNATDSGYLIELALDDPTCAATDADSRAFGNVSSADEWDSASGTFALDLTAGDHTISLCGDNEAGDPFLLNAQISGVFEPGGSLSATATSMSSSSERSSSPF